MSLSQFNNKDNFRMLWDVLLDEMEIDKGNKTLLAKIKTVFDANVQQFMRRANPRALLMDLNKQFLQQMTMVDV